MLRFFDFTKRGGLIGGKSDPERIDCHQELIGGAGGFVLNDLGEGSGLGLGRCLGLGLGFWLGAIAQPFVQ